MITIKSLSEAQYDFLKQYINLIETVEEGLSLVDVSYQERNYGSGDRLLKDLVGVFVPFNSSNMTMRSIFAHDALVLAELDKFQSILDQVLHIETVIHDQDEKTTFIHDFFLPAYKQWKEQIYIHLKMYSTH